MKGKLGSITQLPDNGLEIKPLTVFIGKQGTGKSLVSQFAYFFYNLPYLVAYQQESVRKLAPSEVLVRIILDNLRSDKRAIAVFADPSVSIGWDNFKIHLEQRNRQIRPNDDLKQHIDKITAGEIAYKKGGRALFVPAERVIFPHAGPSVWKLLSWPSTLFLYGDALQNASGIFSQWANNQPPTPEGRLVHQHSREALGGEVVKYGGEWRWQIDRKTKIDLDMASSGQKANWSWLLLAETLFDQREQGLIDEPFRIHIEEPEIHLHPAAQRAMMQILAYLANQGIEVLLTTHSLTMLYELNNLVTAAHMLPDKLDDGRVPRPEFRIPAHKVAAYMFQEDGQVSPLLQEQNMSLEDEAERLEAFGAVVRSHRTPEHKSGIVVFDLPGRDPKEVRARCLAQGVVVSCRGGGVRISPHAYNDASDLDRLMESLAGTSS